MVLKIDSRYRQTSFAVVIPLAVALILSLCTIGWYPFVHSDEVWLASLTQEMMRTGNVSATEPFFVLTPRYPHAIKTLYHLIQMPFVALSFSHLAARSPSLIAGLLQVWLLYRIVRSVTGRPYLSSAVATAFAVDPQVVYIRNFGRQEALILLIMLGGIALLAESKDSVHRYVGKRRHTTGRHDGAVMAGLLVGLGVFIHPNAFIAAAAIVPWLLVPSATGRRWRLFVGIPTIAALIAVGTSILMDSEFIHHYWSFGQSVGVGSSGLRRVLRLRTFFSNLITQNQGTYYLPPVTSRFILGSALVMAVPVMARIKGTRPRPSGVEGSQPIPQNNTVTPLSELIGVAWITIAGGIAVVLSITVIGKFSPPSAVFMFPTVYILAGIVSASLLGPSERFGTRQNRSGPVLGIVLVGLTIALPLTAAIEELPRWYRASRNDGSYTTYTATISEIVAEHAPPETTVLANLNGGFGIPHGQLLAFRDLGAIEAGDDGAMERYLNENDVSLVFLPREELDRIYHYRPLWNDVYGNPSRFYPHLMDVLNDRGTLITTIPAPIYGMRLVRFIGKEKATVEVYRLHRALHTK